MSQLKWLIKSTEAVTKVLHDSAASIIAATKRLQNLHRANRLLAQIRGVELRTEKMVGRVSGV